MASLYRTGHSIDGEIDRNFGKVIEERARMSCSVTALDLCAFAPSTPAEHSFRTLLSSQNTFDPTLTGDSTLFIISRLELLLSI